MRYDGQRFANFAETEHPHQWIFYLGNYKGSPMVTGSENPNNLKTEIYDHESKSWKQGLDYNWSTVG